MRFEVKISMYFLIEKIEMSCESIHNGLSGSSGRVLTIFITFFNLSASYSDRTKTETIYLTLCLLIQLEIGLNFVVLLHGCPLLFEHLH